MLKSTTQTHNRSNITTMIESLIFVLLNSYGDRVFVLV